MTARRRAYLKYDATLPSLNGATRDAEAEVRRAAVGALAFSRHANAVTAIAIGLSDTDWGVRETAAAALGRTG